MVEHNVKKNQTGIKLYTSIIHEHYSTQLDYQEKVLLFLYKKKEKEKISTLVFGLFINFVWEPDKPNSL